MFLFFNQDVIFPTTGDNLMFTLPYLGCLCFSMYCRWQHCSWASCTDDQCSCSQMSCERMWQGLSYAFSFFYSLSSHCRTLK